MKAIDGKLPVDCTYKIVETTYTHVDDDDYCPVTCNNCDKIITKQVTIASESGVYIVGADCAIALLSINNPMMEYQVKKNIRQEMQFKKWLHTECRSAVLSDDILYLYKIPVDRWTSQYTYRCNKKYWPTIPKHVTKITAKTLTGGLRLSR